MTVVTRFAPSPTGFLHIGSARTALFNWLYARRHQGKFLLRIEDTDRERSTPEAVDHILDSLKWLGLNWDEDPVFQFLRASRHASVAHTLVAQGKAYYCYCSPQELEAFREEAIAKGQSPRYPGVWRNPPPSLKPPAGVSPVVRFKAPENGETVIHDEVQGRVCLTNTQLDDMVLLRADGTPTYMLSVVVDDHDMGVTHIIRGDDHLTNAFRQQNLYEACGWSVPRFSHIPLIHSEEGTKLSKRHGALGTDHYRALGFLPEALMNYLLRLGWGHGDEEIISRDQAIAWFDLEGIGQSPARLDLAKLTHLNGHYLRHSSSEALLPLVDPFLSTLLNRPLTDKEKRRLHLGMGGLAQRAKTLVELAESALFYCSLPLRDEKAQAFVTPSHQDRLKSVLAFFKTCPLWEEKALEEGIRSLAETHGEKLGVFAQPLRVALTGRVVSPSIFEIMVALGSEETQKRLQDFCQAISA